MSTTTVDQTPSAKSSGSVLDFLRSRLGEVTTGQGLAAMFGTVAATLNGQMTWQTAVPVLVAAGIGILWPEKK